MALSPLPVKFIEVRRSIERMPLSVFMSFSETLCVLVRSGFPRRKRGQAREDVWMKRKFEGVRKQDADGSILTLRIERYPVGRGYLDLSG
jgi:hypothetical protein